MTLTSTPRSVGVHELVGVDISAASLAVAEAKSIYAALAPADLAALPGAPLPFGDKCARRRD
jgi:predicted TPR repeat methyltransferase